MIRCTRCVLPNTRPDTEFVDGVCAACIAYERRPSIDWAQRETALRELLARHHNRCIVPSSGGKDSHYQILKLKQMGAHVTAVTAMTCHPTAEGLANIQNAARYADETVIYYPNATVRARLNRLGLKMVGDISWPEHVSIFTTPFRAALDLEIPLLFYGENPQNQYGGPMDSVEAVQMTCRWVAEFGGFLGLRPDDLVGVDGLTDHDLEPYRLPQYAGQYAEAHFLGQYVAWDSHANGWLARDAGMVQQRPCTASLWRHENIDNAQTGLHDYFMFLKYGFGRACSQASVDVRMGLLHRSQAMDLVRKFDGAPPLEYMGIPLDTILQRAGISSVDLEEAIESFTNWDLFDRPTAGRWPVLKEWNR